MLYISTDDTYVIAQPRPGWNRRYVGTRGGYSVHDSERTDLLLDLMDDPYYFSLERREFILEMICRMEGF